MKLKLFKQIIIVLLIVLLLLPQASFADDVTIPANSIKIDNHLIYVYQNNDLKTVEIEEYYYINNTGSTSFNNSFYIWIPDNSSIIAYCCDDTPNMACRYDEKEEMWCFYFNKTENDNIYVGYPVSNENKLSYYGQRESITITAFSTTNISLGNDTLQLNVTIGGSYIPKENDSFQGEGVHITSDNQEIGMTPLRDPYEFFNITSFEQIRVYNKGSDDETIEFSISNLPEGWTAEIWNETTKLNNISLSPQKNENLTLIITAPSYLAKIYVGVETLLSTDENEKRGSFSKKSLYDSKIVSYNIYSLVAENLEVSKDLISIHEEPYLLEDYNLFWFLAKAENVIPNNMSTIYIGIEAPSEEINPFFIIIALAVIIILIIFILILRRKDYFKEKHSSQSKTSPKKKTEDKTDKKIDEENKEKKIKEQEKMKKQVISAIKRVEQEFKDGLISNEDYERLRSTYKKRAVDILKEIDRLEGAEHE